MFHVEQGEGANSLSQNLTVLPAPSEREPLALPEALHFSQKPSRHAKGPIAEGAGIEQSEMTGGVFFSLFPLSHPQMLKIQLKNVPDGSKNNLDVLY